MNRLRLGATTEPGAAPLVDGIELPPWSDRATVRLYDEPAGLVRDFDAGALDLALMPVHELLARAAGLEVVPGIALGGVGPSGTALLVHSVPLDGVRRVAARARGHAAELLLRVLYLESGTEISIEPAAARAERPAADPDGPADAELVLGERALLMHLDARRDAVDLGEAWTTLTGLPFVWSVWVSRPGVVDRSVYAWLHSVRSRGRRHLARIAAGIAARHGVPAERIERAARELFVHRLGRRQVEAMHALAALGSAHGLLPGPVESLRFVSLGAGRACQEIADRLARGRRGL